MVKQIEDMDRRGFAMRVDRVPLKVLWQREGPDERTVQLGEHWISRCLNRHPHLASKFSTQVHKQRIISSDPKVLQQSFDVLGPIIKRHYITYTIWMKRGYKWGSQLQ